MRTNPPKICTVMTKLGHLATMDHQIPDHYFKSFSRPTLMFNSTVVPLLRDHPVVPTDVVFEEGWSFIRGRKQCKPKHVSSGIVVLNVRWSLIRVVSQEGDYCIPISSIFLVKIYFLNITFNPITIFKVISLSSPALSDASTPSLSPSDESREERELSDASDS